MQAERVNTFHDSSGLVTVSVFRQVAPNAQEHFTDQAAVIAEDMVVIGGGANTQNEAPGALLTASYPNDQLSAWLASSKDHEVVAPHILITYAIGLAIQGLTRDDLLGLVRVTTADSGVEAHPEASALGGGAGFLLVSGGFRVDWTGAGNLATASFPTSLNWTARSKDHDVSDPANIRVFAISLQETLPVGTVSVAVGTLDSAIADHPRATAAVVQGFAMTGGGADVHWNGSGNLLWLLEPSVSTTLQTFSAASKDHMVPDPCSLTAYSLGIKITPGGTTRSAVDDFIATLGHLPPVNAVAVSPVGPPSTTAVNNGWDAVAQRMQGTAVYDKVAMFGTDQSVIWPGAVLQGGHVLDTAPAPVPLMRNGLTLTVTGLATKAGVSASRRVDRPTTATVTDAMNALLAQSFAGVTTADLDVYVSQAYSLEHSLQQLGISVHYLGLDVKAQMGHSFQEKKASFVANVTQKYFDVSASDPGPTSSYFDPSVTPAQAAPYMGQGNPPVYVSSITFGRRLVLLMLTDAREESFDAAIQATYGWASGSASGNAKVSTSSLMTESTIQLLDIGGSTAAGVKLLSANPGDAAALQAITDYIAAGANWSSNSPGAPIGWTLRYVDDAVGFLAEDALDYNTLSFKRKCFPNTVVVNQDNSGFPNDRTEKHVIPAPDGTKIDVNSVQVSPNVYRGSANVNSVTTTVDAITIEIFTQAAGGGLFGHHSGGINVTVNFTACGA
jgi:Thiol-activated cytolysin